MSRLLVEIQDQDQNQLDLFVLPSLYHRGDGDGVVMCCEPVGDDFTRVSVSPPSSPPSSPRHLSPTREGYEEGERLILADDPVRRQVTLPRDAGSYFSHLVVTSPSYGRHLIKYWTTNSGKITSQLVSMF